MSETKFKVIKIRYNTLQRLKKEFPPLEEESMASYFSRVESFITSLKSKSSKRRARASERPSPASKK